MASRCSAAACIASRAAGHARMRRPAAVRATTDLLRPNTPTTTTTTTTTASLPHQLTMKTKTRVPVPPAQRHRPPGPDGNVQSIPLPPHRRTNPSRRAGDDAYIEQARSNYHLEVVQDVSDSLTAQRILLLLFLTKLRIPARPVSCPHGDAGNVILWVSRSDL